MAGGDREAAGRFSTRSWRGSHHPATRQSSTGPPRPQLRARRGSPTRSSASPWFARTSAFSRGRTYGPAGQRPAHRPAGSTTARLACTSSRRVSRPPATMPPRSGGPSRHSCPRARQATTSMSLGSAGALLGCAILLDALPRTSAAEARRLVDARGDELAGGVVRRARCRSGCLADGALGAAHGVAGMLFALLRWHESAGGLSRPRSTPGSPGSAAKAIPEGRGSSGRASSGPGRPTVPSPPPGATAPPATSFSGRLPTVCFRTVTAISPRPRPGRHGRMGRTFPTSAAVSPDAATRC